VEVTPDRVTYAIVFTFHFEDKFVTLKPYELYPLFPIPCPLLLGYNWEERKKGENAEYGRDTRR
jgi:hypothetical protein